MRRSSRWTVGLLVLAARSLPAQAIGQGFELERAGQYDQAAAIYLATLRADPTNLTALLGLEREQRREIGRIGPQRREIDRRRLVVLPGALKLEALANRLGRQRACRQH